MWCSFVQRSNKDGSARTELSVHQRIREYARPVEKLAYRIVRGLRQACGVSKVASALPVLSEPSELLLVRLVGDLLADVPRVFWLQASNTTGYVGSRMERLIDQMWSMRNDGPYDGIWHGSVDPCKWQIPHVWPGKYAWPFEHPRDGERVYIDPVSGVQYSDNHSSGHIVRIWPTAPLAHWAWDRLMIPLDVVMVENVKCLAYRRHGETLAFLCEPGRADDTRDAVEKIMAVYELDYVITAEKY